MTYADIEAFLAVAECGSFAKAAERLYTSQSTLSWRIASLESECGATLFYRGKGIRNTVLTAEGKTMLPYAARWRDLWQEMQTAITNLSRTTLSISIIDSLNEFLFPEIYRKFIKENPHVDLRLLAHTSNTTCNEVINGTVSAGIVSILKPMKTLNATLLCTERMLLFLGKECKYGDVVDPSELEMDKMVSWGPCSELDDWLQRWMKPINTPKIYVNKMMMLGELLAKEDFWTIIPLSMATGMIKRYPEARLAEMTVEGPSRNIYLVMRKGTLPSAELSSLLNVMRSYIMEHDAN